jgi:hypothetical protein
LSFPEKIPSSVIYQKEADELPEIYKKDGKSLLIETYMNNPSREKITIEPHYAKFVEGGYPFRVSLWVHSDYYKGNLYVIFKNSVFGTIKVNMGSLDFSGWKRMEKEFPFLEKKIRDKSPQKEKFNFSSISIEFNKYQSPAKKLPTDKEGAYIASAIKTPFIWGGLLTSAEREKSYESFLSEATKKGYDTKEGLKKVINDEFKEQSKKDLSRMQSPGIQAFLDRTEAQVVKPGAPIVKEFKTAIVEEADEDEVFKPNMYGANGEADYMEGTYKKMLDNLGAIFQRLLTGEVSSIKSITVHTSADRYRNTKEDGLSNLQYTQHSRAKVENLTHLVVGI